MPQQALVMANSRLTFEHARLMAKSLTEKTNAEDGAFVQAAFARTPGSPPGREEAEACAAYLVSRRAPRTDNADEKVLAEEKEPNNARPSTSCTNSTANRRSVIRTTRRPGRTSRIHATILHHLGIIPSRLDVPGRKRLEKDYGEPLHQIIT